MADDSAFWIRERIRPAEIEKYLGAGGEDFIPDDLIDRQLSDIGGVDDKARVREIIAKSLAISTLTPEETATLLNVRDPELWGEMEAAAGVVKRTVYDNRIVTFAPLYLSTLCVNNCQYCGLRTSNKSVSRGVLTRDEVREEIKVLAGQIGHKRLIVVYGEHPKSDIDYMLSTIETIYNTKVPMKNGAFTAIRRVNVNAAPMPIDELAALNKAGLGTYQVFQETYHKETYRALHPPTTIKGDYRWRLYSMHRALEAGIDDVGIGALFGLYDWKFEVMGLLYHAIELEKKFGIGPHTISFPRLEPAENTPFVNQSRYIVNNEDFRKAVTVIRLAVPYTGMILTARENAELRKSLIPIGITQTDASSNIGLGAYNKAKGAEIQESTRQQFILGDTRSLDDVVRELAQIGYITSFCTAGYRCGRTGQCIMDLLRTGAEGKFCKLNAVITFREWLDDFASRETKEIGERVILKEIEELKEKVPKVYDTFVEYYNRTANGERDLYF